MSDININLNLLTKRYEVNTQKAVSATNKMASGITNAGNKINKSLNLTNASFSKVQKNVFSLRDGLNGFTPSIDKVDSGFGKLAKTIGAGLIGFNLASSAIAGIKSAVATTIRSYNDLEKAQVAVAKTTSLTSEDMRELTDTFRELSGRIPVGVNELLNLGAVAGQLGVDGVDNIAVFAETVAKLNTATDLVGEEGARSLVRILNVTGESAQNIDNLGSAIVSLGNNFAATESEIVRVANEVARSTSQFGVSSDEVLGIATALRSLGIQAQLGGSVVGKTFRAINDAVQGGSEDLDKFSKIAGVSSEVFAKAFSQDKTRGFELFIEGLSRLDPSRVSLNLAELGLKGDEVNKVLPVLATRTDILSDALRNSSKAFTENIALNQEADAAYDTLSSKLTVLTNNFTNLGVIGISPLLGLFESLVEDVNDFFKVVGSGDDELSKLNNELDLLEKKIAGRGSGPNSGIVTTKDRDALIEQRELIKANIVELEKLNNPKTNPIGIEGKLNEQLKSVQDELKLTELGFNTTFGADPNRAEKLREEILSIENQIKSLDNVAKSSTVSPTGSGGSEANVTGNDIASGGSSGESRSKDLVTREKELQAELTRITQESLLQREELELQARLATSEKDEAALARLQEIEEQKIQIAFDAQEAKAQLIEDDSNRKIELDILRTQREAELEEVKAKRIIESNRKQAEAKKKIQDDLAKARKKKDDEEIQAAKDKADKLANFEKNKTKDQIAASGKLFGALSDLSKKGSGERKGFAIAEATINTYLGATRALAEGGPFAGPILAAAMIAQGLANVSKITSTGNFERGGIITGGSNTGDRLVANVNSGEAILNTRQQQEFLRIANGESDTSRGLDQAQVSSIVQQTVANMNITLVANDNEIARSVSRGVSNGVVIGVSE